MVKLLELITPTKDFLEAFIALLRRTYYKRVAQLQKKKNEADVELKRLHTLRQSLIEKNLSGTYSDEIFKEQNKLIEEQIITVQISKDDTVLAKYNLESIVTFMKEKFANLGKTYQESDLSKIRVLLGSIFPVGVVYNGDFLSNQQTLEIITVCNAQKRANVSLPGNNTNSEYPSAVLSQYAELERIMSVGSGLGLVV